MTLRFALTWAVTAALAVSSAARSAEPKKPPSGNSITPAPNLALMAVWVADDTSAYDPRGYGPWIQTDCSYALGSARIKATLASFQQFIPAEKAYLQEKDVFASFPLLGFGLTADKGATDCWKYTITLGHFGGAKPRTSFLMTAEPFFWYQMKPLPGPTFCMTSAAGARPAFTVGFSAGGPIFDAPSCARLPPGSAYQPLPPPAKPVTAVQTK
jgi:hypothetical protein